MKRFLLVLLALLMLFSCALAEDDIFTFEDYEFFTSGNYQYRILENGSAEITMYVGDDETLVIPDLIDGKVVTSIGEVSFVWGEKLTSVFIPDTVVSIGEQAFSGCHNLASVSIPDSVASIGSGAFTLCANLTCISIPDSVTSIGANPFDSCVNLRKINVSPDHPTLAVIDGALFYKPDKKLIYVPLQLSEYSIPVGTRTIGNRAFSYCDNLTSVLIPDSVSSIEHFAFSYCDSLASVSIPDSVVSIGNYAFQACQHLTSISIPDSVTSIGVGAFFYCSNLASVSIPASVISIEEDAFAYCSPSLVLAGSHGSYAEQYANDNRLSFICSDALTVNEIFTSGDYQYRLLEDGTAEIDFYSGKAEELYIPNMLDGKIVTSIGESAFVSCNSLISVFIPNSVTSIGLTAFCNCKNLATISIPDSVASINNRAFYSCKSLTSVFIPDSVSFIGKGAFDHCRSDLTLTVPRGSYAAQYAKENGLEYTYPDALDWLNN